MDAAVPVGERATTAQNITKARKRRGQSVTGELATLSDKFSAIYGEVQQKVTQEHEQQEDRLAGVEDHITRIQHATMVEQHRRVQMLKRVEANLEQLYKKIASECTAQLEALRRQVAVQTEAARQVDAAISTQRASGGLGNPEQPTVADLQARISTLEVALEQQCPGP